MKPIRYSDFKTDFSIHPIKGDILLNTDERAIATSIRNLLFTGKYERFYEPEKGAGIPQELFEQMNNETAFIVERRVREVLAHYEPRAEIVNVSVVTNIDYNEFICKVTFRPINSHTDIEVKAIFRRIR